MLSEKEPQVMGFLHGTIRPNIGKGIRLNTMVKFGKLCTRMQTQVGQHLKIRLCGISGRLLDLARPGLQP